MSFQYVHKSFIPEKVVLAKHAFAWGIEFDTSVYESFMSSENCPRKCFGSCFIQETDGILSDRRSAGSVQNYILTFLPR